MPASVDLPVANLSIQPGDAAAAAIRVRNTGLVVDEFAFEILGDAAAWADVQPPRLPLFPGAEAEVRVTFRPARASSPRAGQVPFGVRVRSREDAGFSYVAEGRVQVGVFRSVAARISPRTSSARRTSGRAVHQVRIDNAGNAAAVLRVTAADPDELVSFDIRPSTVTVDAGASASVTVTATARDRPLQGQPRTLPFQVTVSSDNASPIALDAAIVRRPLLAVAVLPLAAIVVPVIAVGALLGRSMLGATGPSPSVLAGTSAPASPSASDGPTSPGDSVAHGTSGSGSAPATREATGGGSPSPSIVEPAVTFAGLSVEDSGNPDSVPRQIGFAADGPGTVSITIARMGGGSKVRICLEPDGAPEDCTSAGEGTIARSTGAGSTNWVLTIEGAEPGMAPSFDLGLNFASQTPALQLKGFRFAGASAATNGLDMRIRDRNPGTLTFDATWPVSATYSLTLTNLTNRGVTPLDSSGGPAGTASLPANDLSPGDLYRLQFVGTGITDEVHFDATIGWP